MLRLDLRDGIARVGRYGESEQITSRAAHENLRRLNRFPGRCARSCGGGSKLTAAGRGCRSRSRGDQFIPGTSLKVTPIGTGYFRIKGGFAPRLSRSRPRDRSPKADAPSRRRRRSAMLLMSVVMTPIGSCPKGSYRLDVSAQTVSRLISDFRTGRTPT